ncbi:MerR family transcriptional regulator [Solicola gregarius]|uniref:MerR family transcriptional regulator n=1 Tax=Solicola gregarius TaxID=2908642 RepID=A0AA46TH65_9ACTN|nr:MerR family transcriptional regulator [Solicola gregarius]UYM05287.1 MerR family transcriptional regulator [Solicola gregarius]
MTEPLLTISAFARAVDLAPGTLRYYDEAELLAPTEVDANTGYRYYTPELERRAHMIRRMRDVGVPIETMRSVLDGPVDDAAHLLQGFAERANESAQRAQSAVADVIASLRAESATAKPVSVLADAAELAAALRRVVPAASGEPDSPLGVVALDIHDDTLSVVATDRYWLACWDVPLADHDGDPRRFVVARSRVADVATWLARREVVRLTEADGRLRLTDEGGGSSDVGLEVDRFPAYRLIVDGVAAHGGRATLDRSSLLAALAPAESTALVVRVGTDRVTVQPHGSAEGVRLEATTSGAPVELGFSPTLLGTALNAMVGTDVTLAYDAADRAVRLGSAEQRRFLALVMPMKLEPTA